MNHCAARSASDGAEPPGAGPDEDIGPQSAEPLDGDRDGVRAEQAAPLRRAALVGVECGGHAGVQWIRRAQVDATDDGQGQQHGAPGAGTDGDQPGQLLAGQQVQQRRGGDEGCVGEIVRVQPGDVGLPGLDGDRGPVGGRAGEVRGGDGQQVGVPVVQDPVLRSGQPRREPAAHRPGAAAEVVDHLATGRRKTSPQLFDEVGRTGRSVSGLAEGEPSAG